MAFTYYYVDLADGGTGSAGTKLDPFSWADLSTRMSAGGGAAPGDYYYVKGNVTLGATAAWTIDGTTASPIVFHGCDAFPANDGDPGDLDELGRDSGGLLITSSGSLDFPIITCGAYRLALPGSTNCIYKCIVVNSNQNAPTIQTGINTSLWRCLILNSNTGSSAIAANANGNRAGFIDCDFELSGASGGKSAVALTAGGCFIDGGIIRRSQADGVTFGDYVSSAIIINLVFKDVAGKEIYYNSKQAGDIPPYIRECTLHGGGGAGSVGYYHGDAGTPVAFTYIPVIINSILTNHTVGIQSAYAATAELAGVFAHNTMKNTTEFTGFGAGGGWDLAARIKGQVPTSATSEYVDAANDDLRLVVGAVSKAAGLLPYTDIGALQRQEPVDRPEMLIFGAG